MTSSSSSSQQISNEEFLSRLSPLLEASKEAHSVHIKSKRVSKDISSSSSNHWPVVFRATDGKGKANQGRIKFSTQVSPEDLTSFQEKYTTILRSSFAMYLKKRDKAKERRTDKTLREIRKRMEEAEKIKVTSMGSTRGAGRRKRTKAKKKSLKIWQEKKRIGKVAKATTISIPNSTAATSTQ